MGSVIAFAKVIRWGFAKNKEIKIKEGI